MVPLGWTWVLLSLHNYTSICLCQLVPTRLLSTISRTQPELQLSCSMAVHKEIPVLLFLLIFYVTQPMEHVVNYAFNHTKNVGTDWLYEAISSLLPIAWNMSHTVRSDVEISTSSFLVITQVKDSLLHPETCFLNTYLDVPTPHYGHSNNHH